MTSTFYSQIGYMNSNFKKKLKVFLDPYRKMKPVSPVDVIYSLLGGALVTFVSSSLVALAFCLPDRASFVSRYIVAAAVGHCAHAITVIVYISVRFMGVDGVVATNTQVFTHGVVIQLFLGYWKMLLQLILTGCILLGGS